MFCELEQVELKVDICPVQCIYRAANGKCSYSVLTDDDVDATAIAKVTGKKIYRIKAQGAAAKQMIEIGLAIDRYAEYIRDVVPKSGAQAISEPTLIPKLGLVDAETVNGVESSSGVNSRLKRVFNLTDNQQEQFWSKDLYLKWSKRSGSSVTLREMRHALISI